jgi:hypothetical protein
MPARPRPHLIFDADDTLWENNVPFVADEGLDPAGTWMIAQPHTWHLELVALPDDERILRIASVRNLLVYF